MKKIHLATALIFWQVITFAQPPGPTPLQVGDRVPDLALELHTGDSISHVHLSDFKGRVIIFDTWNTHCPSCQVITPTVLALQRKFEGKVKIIYLSLDDEATAREWRLKMRGHMSRKIFDAQKELTFVYGTGEYGKQLTLGLFASAAAEHLWIDADGIFKAWTAADATDAQTIQNFLDGNTKNMVSLYPQTIDPLKLLPKDQAHVYAYSTLLNLKTDVFNIIWPAERPADSLNNDTPGFIAGGPILDLYKDYAYKDAPNIKGYRGSIPPDRIVLEVVTQSRFFPNPQYSMAERCRWDRDNTYIYLSKLPGATPAAQQLAMRKDLDSYFNVTSGIETRKVKCFVLKRIGREDILAARSKEAASDFFQTDSGFVRIFHKYPYASLASEIKQIVQLDITTQFTPFIDETGFKEDKMIDAVLAVPDSDRPDNEPRPSPQETLKRLRASLKRYGLELAEEYREWQVLVIRSNDYKRPSTL